MEDEHNMGTEIIFVFKENTFPLLTHREIDFVKKEEELKKSLDEKDKWYKEQLETLQQRVRAPPRAWGDGRAK